MWAGEVGRLRAYPCSGGSTACNFRAAFGAWRCSSQRLEFDFRSSIGLCLVVWSAIWGAEGCRDDH